MTRDEALKRLLEAREDLEHAGIAHVYLFGSTARNEAGPRSDIDLFFDIGRDDFGMFDLIDARELVADVLGTKIDLIPRDGLHRSLRAGIEASAVQVF